MKQNLPLAAIQQEMSYIMHATGSKPWNLANELNWVSIRPFKHHAVIPSRNKREGQYAGRSLLNGMHHRIYHHKKPAGFKSVGTKLLLAIF